SYNTDISENNKIINATKSTEEGPVNNYRFNFDFDNKNLAFGYLGNIINRDDRYKFYIYDTTQNIYVLKSNYSVNFYRFTNGIYSSYNNNYKKIQYQLGLRFENTKRKIADFEKDYNDIFPSFNISYKLFQTYQFYLNYSRRISHPRPWQLEPFEVQLDQISKRRGNPNLNPEYANSIELGLQTSYTDASIYYRKVENTIDEITTYENNYFITYPENLGFSEFFGSEFSINFKKGRFMEFSSSINTYQQNLYSNRKTSSFSYDIRTTIRLLVLQFTGVYNSPRKGWQGEISQNYYIDAGLRFLYRNFVFVLNFSDILKTNRIKSEVQGTNYYQTQEIKNKWPSIQFIMIYNFQVLRKYQKPQQREEEMEGF
ncbi:MAG: outer membrane beta-barrel family protein, partial [candidate division WOR-3 bacterium]|nr:outer membrane beta-barrel family protein [candidate division WOR-3 bacterium]